MNISQYNQNSQNYLSGFQSRRSNLLNTVCNYQMPRKKEMFFGVRVNPDFYVYDKFGTNGKLPDEFIINKIKEFTPDPKNAKILDVGAGDGRNAIPIAKIGYNVTALEIIPAARNIIHNLAIKEGIENKISFLNINILDDWKINEKYDLIYMSHVSQHLNTVELTTFFKNANKVLKKDGIIIFDALLVKKENVDDVDFNNSKNIKIIEKLEKDGNAFFDKQDIINEAKNNGFELDQIELFNETGRERARYEKEWCHPNTFSSTLLTKDFYKNLSLNWFVLKKSDA